MALHSMGGPGGPTPGVSAFLCRRMRDDAGLLSHISANSV